MKSKPQRVLGLHHSSLKRQVVLVAFGEQPSSWGGVGGRLLPVFSEHFVDLELTLQIITALPASRITHKVMPMVPFSGYLSHP